MGGTMNADQWTKIIEILAWPIMLLLLILLLRNAIAGAISRLKGLEAPAGWKLLFEVRKVGDRLQKLEELTTDIYHLSGKSQAVRDEIFAYVADILNRVSPQTALEMKTELNRYHMPRLGVSAILIKKMLSKLKYYEYSESEQDGFSNDISPEFIEALYNFQKSNNMRDADGIIGPKTLELLASETSSHNLKDEL